MYIWSFKTVISDSCEICYKNKILNGTKNNAKLITKFINMYIMLKNCTTHKFYKHYYNNEALLTQTISLLSPPYTSLPKALDKMPLFVYHYDRDIPACLSKHLLWVHCASPHPDSTYPTRTDSAPTRCHHLHHRHFHAIAALVPPLCDPPAYPYRSNSSNRRDAVALNQNICTPRNRPSC